MPYKDPQKAAERQRQYRAAQRTAPGRVAPVHPLPSPVRLKAVGDIMAMLEEEINNVRAAPVLPIERARAVGYLAGLAFRGLEVGDLAARLEALEQRVKEKANS